MGKRLLKSVWLVLLAMSVPGFLNGAEALRVKKEAGPGTYGRGAAGKGKVKDKDICAGAYEGSKICKKLRHKLWLCPNFVICGVPAPTTTTTTTTTTTMTTTRTTTPTPTTPTTTITSFGPSTSPHRRRPDAPPGLARDDVPYIPDGSVGACVDLVFLLDLSCSIPERDRLLAKTFIKLLASKFNFDNDFCGANIGVIPYSKNVIMRHVIHFGSFNGNISQFTKRIDAIEINQECRTYTMKALKMVYTDFLYPPNDRVPDSKFKDLVILIGDGRSSTSTHKYAHSIAKRLRRGGANIAYVRTKTAVVNKHRHDTAKDVEFGGKKEINQIVSTWPGRGIPLVFDLKKENKAIDTKRFVEMSSKGIIHFIYENYSF